MPETSYTREIIETPVVLREADAKSKTDEYIEMATPTPPKRTYLQGLSLYSGTYTKESVFKLMIRPVVFLALPPVLWATLVMAVTIGFLVAITSNFATAFSETYGFQPWQSGLCFVAGLIGSFIGIFCGGHLSDQVAHFLTKRNGGIREPEMRLPALTISLITTPLGLILYGAGISHSMHWIVPVIGLGLCKLTPEKPDIQRLMNLVVSFSTVQSTNVTLVYTIDAYRPVAGEVVVAQFGFKCNFLLPDIILQ